MKQQKNTLLAVLIGLALCILPAILQAKESEEQDTYRNLETFADVLTLLQQHYVDPIDTNKVIIGAINGMLSSLDPHSSYMEPDEFKELQEETKGSFSGIGIEITIKDSILTVVSPIEGTPAFKQGLRAGDQIIGIDGKPTKNMTLMQAVKKLRGKKGSKVTITIYHPADQSIRDMTLARDIIPLHSVRSMDLAPGLFYVRISNFQTATTSEVRKALHQARKEGNLHGLVLDLRNNPGGLLDQAVKVSDIFLDSGVIVSTRGRDGEQDMVFKAHRNTDAMKFPMVVLVNGGSASASEIVAGALKDHRRAIICGTVTFGKGSVQTIIPMAGGAGIRLTTARYYTPSGASIQETGIVPDVVVPFAEPSPEKKDKARAWEIREKDLPGHFRNGEKENQAERADRDTYSKARKKLKKDNQLRAAYIILKSLNIAARKEQKTAREQLPQESSDQE
jgi:carboxyl-terminal processing protease